MGKKSNRSYKETKKPKKGNKKTGKLPGRTYPGGPGLPSPDFPNTSTPSTW